MLVCVLLLLVSVFSSVIIGHPWHDFFSTSFVVGCLILAKGVTTKRVYKNWIIDVMETSIYFNLAAFAVCTWYTLESDGNQVAVAYTSVMITFIPFLAVVAFHILRYTRLYSCPLVQKMFELTSCKLSKKKVKNETPDVHEELDWYQFERLQESAIATHSDMEIPHSS